MTRKQKLNLVAVALVVLVLALWSLSAWFLWDEQNRGEIGDMFGAINSLFSGLAVAGVGYAIVLQREELRLQRKELRLNRDELRGQRLALDAQTQTLRRQNFESTFFQMLDVLEDIIRGIGVHRSAHSTEAERGRDAFPILYRKLRGKWSAEATAPATEAEKIKRAYAAFHAENEADLGHYFRTLYNIIKLVDRSDVSDKRFYTNCVRAQLSSFELAILFYNCLSDLGAEKFKPLVEKYALLKTVPTQILFNASDHVALFDRGAFVARPEG